jgi:ABC-type cobalamin/Fe3+-siderophores transport system ATPase subunit
MRPLGVESASFAYNGGVPVLRDVSVAARPGEMLAVTGTSGAGKTTLLSAMAGLVPPKDGRVLLDGVPLRDRDHAVGLGAAGAADPSRARWPTRTRPRPGPSRPGGRPGRQWWPSGRTR